jgi:hypothetical protein
MRKYYLEVFNIYFLSNLQFTLFFRQQCCAKITLFFGGKNIDFRGGGGINQGCGSGTGSILDPYSIGSVDPDPDPYSESGSGSGSRRAKMTHKSRKNW